MWTWAQVHSGNILQPVLCAAVFIWSVCFGTACERKLFPSTAIPGSEVLKLPAASPEHCHAMCTAHPKCTFFSFEGSVCVFDKSALRQSFYVHLSNRSFLITGVPSAATWSIIQMRWWSMLKTESHPGYRHVSVSRITVCISSQHVTVRKDSLSTGI